MCAFPLEKGTGIGRFSTATRLMGPAKPVSFLALHFGPEVKIAASQVFEGVLSVVTPQQEG